MKTKHPILTTAVILIAIVVSAQTFGQEPGKLKRAHECCGMMDLTEEQQAKIEELKTNLEKAILPMKTKLGVKQAELQELLVAENPNKAAIDKKIDEISGLRTQMQKKHINHRLEVRALLTPEQRVKFDHQCLRGHKNSGHCGMGKGWIRAHEFKKGCRPLQRVEKKVEIEK